MPPRKQSNNPIGKPIGTESGLRKERKNIMIDPVLVDDVIESAVKKGHAASFSEALEQALNNMLPIWKRRKPKS